MINEGNGIYQTVISNNIADSGSYPTQQVSFNDKTCDTTMLWPYGFGGVAPAGSLGISVAPMGYEEILYTIPMLPSKRVNNLAVGEVYMSNLLTGTSIIQKENGDMEITVKNDLIIVVDNDKNITIGGNAVINIGGSATVSAQGEVNIESAGAINLDSDNVNLGFGGLPIARLGDEVTTVIDGVPYVGNITTASNNNTST